MESLIFQIILIGVAIAININSEIRDGVEGDTKKQIIEKKKWHSKLSIRLLIFTFCFSIGGQIFDWHAKSQERKRQKEDYDYSIAKLDTSINKGNDALVFLNGVKTSTTLILDSVKRQLALQSKTILVQKDLLRKNEALVLAQSQIYKNTDATLNPFFPVSMFLDLIVVNNNEQTNYLKKRMFEIKAEVEKKQSHSKYYFSYTDDNNSNKLSIHRGDSLLENSDLVRALIRSDLIITFSHNSFGLPTDVGEKTIFSFGVSKEIDSNLFTWIEYDFKKDELHFKQRYYRLNPVNVHATKNTTYDIFKNLFFRFNIETFYKVSLNRLELISTFGIARRLNFLNTWHSFSTSNWQIFSHKISDKNIIYNKNFFEQ